MNASHRVDHGSRLSNSGSAALELVLLTPVLVALMLFIVFAGRAGEGMSELRHAADQGARAASQASRTRMQQAARTAVLGDLRTSGLSCVFDSCASARESSAHRRPRSSIDSDRRHDR
jgi:Flp pilus assembly protein TadG